MSRTRRLGWGKKANRQWSAHHQVWFLCQLVEDSYLWASGQGRLEQKMNGGNLQLFTDLGR